MKVARPLKMLIVRFSRENTVFPAWYRHYYYQEDLLDRNLRLKRVTIY